MGARSQPRSPHGMKRPPHIEGELGRPRGGAAADLTIDRATDLVVELASGLDEGVEQTLVRGVVLGGVLGVPLDRE